MLEARVETRVRRVVFLLMALAAPFCVTAQVWPAKPVKVIVPYPPGGSTDILARVLAEKISPSLGQPMVVENRAGATGVIGAEAVAKSPADGYTLLMGVNGPITIAPAIRSNLPYEPLKDFAPVILIADAPKLLVINPSIPANTLQEFLVWAKAQPKPINFASAGVGATGHLASEMLKQRGGFQGNHIPYKGGGPAITDVIAGHVQYMFEVMPQLLPHVQAGRLKALGISSTERSKALPSLPTIAEQGLPGFQSSTWFGILAPAGTPTAVLARLNSEFSKALSDADMAKRLADLGASWTPNSPAEYLRFLRADLDKWREVVAKSGARFD
ncbi:MAG: tripartite tricarboxylate transporter substrate binding protein [Candidatus Parcubacteria bacterium]|nr:tripartite tricarboxylate transporter substrate binding protein [Burkholderiales bacterium]